ncbi:unnamed protein product [Amaranthus hypochondriacus]
MAAQNKIQNFSSTSKSQIKFLCSYGGKILPRPSDGLLRYVGGLTRVVSVYRSVTFTELMAKLEDLCGFPVSLRCQLPSEDLDVLISIKSNDDLFNVIEEYDKASLISGKELKIRAILSSSKSASSSTTSPTSSSSSSCADLSPTKRKFFNPGQKPLMRRINNYNIVRDNCHYNPCHIQANSRLSSYILPHSNRLH